MNEAIAAAFSWDYRQAVSAGIALMDEKAPPGWRDRIDVTTLNLSCGQHCVLGQVYGAYEEGWNVLAPSAMASPWEYGFSIPFGIGGDYRWSQLTEEWKRQLAYVLVA